MKSSLAALLVMVSGIAAPAFAHHEGATRVGVRLSAGLKGLPGSMEQRAKSADAAQKSAGKQKAEPVVRVGRRKARREADKILILGGAEAFPM